MEVLNGYLCDSLLKAGLNRIKREEDVINRMNVFPVPDGDTGSNMRHTLENGIHATRPREDLGAYMAELSMGMLFGARGNSGVILSQIFKGISKGLEGKKTASAADLTAALNRGYETAYQAVAKPAEGTMLTVAREAAQQLYRQPHEDLRSVLNAYLAQMKRTLRQTPEMLPVLKEAGVVDSGGMGLVAVFEGMVCYLNGEETTLFEGTAPLAEVSGGQEDDEFGYCTEAIVELFDTASFSREQTVSVLEGMGTSLVLICDGNILKMHLHAEDPLPVLTLLRTYGDLVSVKIENMDIQHREKVKKEREAKAPQVDTAPAAAPKAIAYVAVAQGEGMRRQLLDLGCDAVIAGGQTMNTSAEEFVRVFNGLNAEQIIVMPNNRNIESAARQAAELSGRSNVSVLPTDSVAQGYFAMSMAVPTETRLRVQLNNMRRGLEGVSTLYITRAVRETSISGIHCLAGQYIGVAGHQMYSAADSVEQAVIQALEDFPHIEEKETLLLIRGCNYPAERAEALTEALEEKFDWLSPGIIDGGQEVYDLVIGITG